MAILVTTKNWRKPSTALAMARTPDLTPEEMANVKRAIAYLRVRLGGYRPLAQALGVGRVTVANAGARKGRPSAAMVLRLARVAKVSASKILEGRFPPEGACPHCGRGGA